MITIGFSSVLAKVYNNTRILCPTKGRVHTSIQPIRVSYFFIFVARETTVIAKENKPLPVCLACFGYNIKLTTTGESNKP